MATESKNLVLDNSKEITFFITSLTGGGAESVCVNIANGLADLGWDITLVVLNMRNSVYDCRLSSKVNLVVLEVSNARYAFRPLYRYVKDNKINRLVVFNYELTVIFLLIRMFTTLNFYLISRNINSISEKAKHFERSWRASLLFWFLKKIYKRADCVINQCRAMDDDLLSFLPELKGKTKVIYNPVNRQVESFVNTRGLTSSGNDGNYILCVGRIERQKAFHFAIKAFASLKNDFPSLRLKIVGKGSLEGELKQLSEELGVSDKVDFEGFICNTIPYYSNAKVTLLTSLYEGFPNVLVESISLGVPVVSFNCKSGPSEIIVDDVNGFLVPAYDEERLVNALRSTLSRSFCPEMISKTARFCSQEMVLSEWVEFLNS